MRLSQFICGFGLVLLATIIALSVPVAAQCRPAGLHAGITAQVISIMREYTENPRVQLSFVLLNDSDSTLDVHEGSWKIVVNGDELADSGMIFGNGPMPQTGWTRLRPGEHYEFGKGLPLPEYFPHGGEYRISWKGDQFQSPTVIVKIPDPVR